MAKASGGGRIPDVILPWAQQRFFTARDGRGASSAAAPHDTIERVRTLADSDARAMGQPRHFAAAPVADVLDGPLRALGLPATPFPTIAEADRAEVSTDTTLQVAVVLDVLGTLTRRGLGASPHILHELLKILREVACLTDDQAGDGGHLLAQAEGRLGRCRAVLAAHLTGRSGNKRGAPGGELPAALANSPASVREAVRCIERLAELCVREADLFLTTQDGVDYRRA